MSLRIGGNSLGYLHILILSMVPVTELRGAIPIGISIIGIILFVGIPLPTTGTWTASAIASILKMRIKDAFMGVFLGNLLSGVIVSALSLHII